jgi:hypothetical protein
MTKKSENTKQNETCLKQGNSAIFTYESSPSEEESENEEDRAFINDTSDEIESDLDVTSVVQKYICSRERDRKR